MKLEDQVCSLELAKKLKALGVTQESLYSFGAVLKESICNIVLSSVPDWKFWDQRYSAFTVAELGEMLPTLGISWVKSNNGRGRDYWWGRSSYPTLGEDQIESADYSEADARAKMLIKMIERGLVKP